MTMGDTMRVEPQRHEDHPLVTNNNNHHHTHQKKKRRRLSQVVDKLVTLNNNVVHHQNNNNDSGKTSMLSGRQEEMGGEVFNCPVSEDDDVEDVFSPASSNKSPHSSNTDSPKISFSPLRLKDSSVEEDTAVPPPAGCTCAHCLPYPSSPASPLPAPVYNFEHYITTKYLPDLIRRRSHSDSDLPVWFEAAKTDPLERGSSGVLMRQPAPKSAPHPLRHTSLESERSTPQDSPLDLSMKTGLREPPLQLFPSGFLPAWGAVSVPVVKGDVASPTTKESVAVWYNLEVSPVVEEMPPGSDVAYVCPVCGQMFSLHDRLAKHMASRHKSRAQTGDSTAKAYLCEVCKRSFARSDMLTRHMRLHTGIKPYTCLVCKQVFSRSDHLSTHQRTHTGEKPYKCPQCPYAACRRDMITRHMRTHTRYEPGEEPPDQPSITPPYTNLTPPTE
ncbi:zinc finger protein klumpfuss [Lycorma delicatula]|uniref:zinc finger protein klumpfuss n=1 Tax=Lycorma delicatula TaxID=130591 RepID=UPI003F50F5D0